MRLVRYIFLSVLFLNISYACTLCKLETPVVLVSTEGYQKKGEMFFDIKWEFEKEFSAQTLLAYDMNGDSTPQKNELKEVKLSLEDYLKDNKHLTHINTKKDTWDFKKFDFEVIDSKIDYQRYKLIYTYKIKVAGLNLNEIDLIKIQFFDAKEFFDFVFKKFYIKDVSILKTERKKDQITKYLSEVLVPSEEIKDESEESGGVLDFLREILLKLKSYISDLLTDIKDNNSLISYIWLLVFSFAYGVIHALGPGHGKSLVASYFLSKDGSLLKALNISVMIGVVHTFSAFLLTFTIYYILKSVLSDYFYDVEAVAIKASALVIIGIAGYLLYKKLRKPASPSFTVGEQQKFGNLSPASSASGNQQNFVKFSSSSPAHVNSHTCECNACKTDSTDVWVILAAGIIPCPGTITIFVFTFGLGIYFVGFLSAIWMSIGMSFIIFLAAYLSIKVKSTSNSNPMIKKVLEYGSLAFIMGLGLMLLLF